jgi:GTP-binding protein HflX
VVASRALLVQVALRGAAFDAEAGEELQQLVLSAGMSPAAVVHARRDRPDPAFYIGSGKVQELKDQARAVGAGVLVIDVQLSPVQQRNLERELAVPVLDRTALILDIFSRRAQSREGKLQVELAQLDYLSTRLVRGWTHLERQRGGIGLRGGPGEKQIELDRRMIGVRVRQLRDKLKVLERQRGTQRRARMRGGVYRVSLVGYTNAGKSTLFNALTHAEAYAADQLFATLDTTSRRCHAAPGVSFVLSDTVGFVRELPHTLVEAFRSTLDETAHADLLLHVIDAASPARVEQAREVDRVLEEIGAEHVPRLRVHNKVDRLGRPGSVVRGACGSIEEVWLSAHSGEGVGLLREAIAGRIAERERLRASPEIDPFETDGSAPAHLDVPDADIPEADLAHADIADVDIAHADIADAPADPHRSPTQFRNIFDAI